MAKVEPEPPARQSPEPPARQSPEPPAPEPPAPERPESPGPESVSSELADLEAALGAALDSLGQAHHRPFSRA
jgi:hypothetical protein